DEAKDGAEAMFLSTKKEYDVYLLDINLPKKDGISLTKYLKLKNNNAKILALTSHNEDYMIRQMLDAGALGYILKNSDIEELVKAIQSVSRGELYNSNDVWKILMSGNNPTNPIEESSEFKLRESLTKREIQILKLIAQEMTDAEIGDELNISKRTAGNHRTKLKSKLQVKNSVGLGLYAIRYGLVK
ncbi:MAG: response regulator transcription factor, partial [Crocinitomicaceae bacterium]|nr:response regulator transcription factor [Crocinitomicaceae bacterium]